MYSKGLTLTFLSLDMVHRSWAHCANDDKYNKKDSKLPKQEFVGTTWINWPKDSERRKLWIRACGRADLSTPDEVSTAPLTTRWSKCIIPLIRVSQV